MTDADARAETAREAAEAGAAVAAELFRADLAVERKDGKTDLVTRADREAEEAVLETIEDAFPGEPVVAEETASGADVPDDGPAWIVDPIDGTNNYVHDIPVWATAVAAVVDSEAVGAAVVLPAVGDSYVADVSGSYLDGEPIEVSPRTDPETQAVAPTFWWGLDRRDEYGTAATEIVERFGDLVRFRSAQATLAMVAAGSVDATFTNRETHAWDTVAGAFLVEQAGGRVTDVDGEPWRHDSRGLVASSGHNHDDVVAAARAVDDERN